MRYLVVIERARRNYSAYVPDLPGCVATGATAAAARKAIQGAIEFHIQGLREDGLPVPKPSARSAQIPVKGGRKAKSAA
jgi:predicted RNase H-like HicB family nuclease